MSKSVSAKIMTSLLHFWPKITAEESEEKMVKALAEGEEPTSPPDNIVTRYEENESLRQSDDAVWFPLLAFLAGEE